VKELFFNNPEKFTEVDLLTYLVYKLVSVYTPSGWNSIVPAQTAYIWKHRVAPRGIGSTQESKHRP